MQVKGYRIELGEVENALRNVPGAAEAVACVTDDSPKRLFAGVTPAEVEGVDTTEAAAALAETDLRQAVGELVPTYMVPEQVEIFESVPLTRNGKTDRKAIAAEVPARGAAVGEGDAPATPLEVALTRIVDEVLPEELG